MNKLNYVVDESETYADTALRPNFEVRPTRAVRQEYPAILTPDQLAWTIDQLQFLNFFGFEPREQFLGELDVKPLPHKGERFLEYRLRNHALGIGDLRVFMWAHDTNQTIWIIYAYFKRLNKLEACAKNTVARRIRNMRGALQDGTVP